MVKLYNTLTRKLEEFKPIEDERVGIYSCGPTVYWNQHIGNMYAFTQWDLLVRVLRYLGYKVKWVMNITDVGHKTSDEDTGEDKMEKGAKREGLDVWQIAEKYIAQFRESLSLLNITVPDVLPRATEHIKEQIELIQKIERNGFTYQTKTGLVFDTAKFPGYADFAHLNLDEQNAGARVEVDPEKKKPWDFLLWVTNQPNHIMQWDSPWGFGFPGWHVECTAMSVKYLGEQFDIHTGGKEHIPIHHTNEIAQAFGAFGRQTANYWLHNEWLVVKGTKASKSLGNVYLVSDVIDKGINSLALRYLYMTSHYRAGLHFTWESLGGAQTALERLYEFTNKCHCEKRSPVPDGTGCSDEAIPKDDRDCFGDKPLAMTDWQDQFVSTLSNDLNMPQALAIVWEMLKSSLEDDNKYALLLDWDKVLGLKLEVAHLCQGFGGQGSEIKGLLDKRENLRKEKKWEEADQVRKEIEGKGWLVEDTLEGQRVKKNDKTF